MSPFSAYEFGSYSCGGDMSPAYLVIRQSDGNGNFLKMHAYKSISDIDPRIGSYLLECDGIRKSMVCGRCKRTSGLWLRNDIYDVRPRNSRSFYDDRTV